MTPRKKLIEVALPLEAINKASAREKSIRHGHPSTLHLWWARRPLAAARAVIFASLVDDPDSPDAPPAFVRACEALPRGENATVMDTPRMRLFDFIEQLVTWENTTNEAVLEDARRLIRLSTDGNPPPLLDPFAGGGSIPLEAQRLGLEAHASDLNPVAVMINKAQIEIPPRFAGRPPVNPESRKGKWAGDVWQGAKGLAADVRYYGGWMREQAWQQIGHLYPTHNGETVIAWIWARTVKSPNPAVDCHVPLVRSFELSKKKGKRAYVVPHFDAETKTLTYEVRHGDGEVPDGTVNRKGGRCVVSDTTIPFEYIRAEAKAGRMGAHLIGIVTEGEKQRNYYSPTLNQVEAADVPAPQNAPDSDLPDQALGFRIQAYGMTKFRDLFTPRQLTALTTFSDLVAVAREKICKDALAAGLANDDVPLRDVGTGARAYSEAVSVYLAFAVDRLLQRCNACSGWDNSADLVRTIFARQAISMVWDFAEANPFSVSTGSFNDAPEWIAEVLESTKFDISTFNVFSNSSIQTDAAQIDNERQMSISTDPPYYDNIGYADLSDYFYVWMRPILKNTYPSMFKTLLVPKEPELIATPFRFGGDWQAANRHFESGMIKAFTRMCKFASILYPLTVYYAFKQIEDDDDEDEESRSTQVVSTGWETMLSGLIQSGFSIGGTWPLRTELGNRLRNRDSNALASSIVLVCRPRAADAPTISRRGFIEALTRELPLAVRELQSGNIAPVDLAQASIGPGMAVYSRYSQVLEANGAPLTVRQALGLINTVLDSTLAEQEGDLDADTRFAVAWFEQYEYRERAFGDADILARAKNTSVGGVERAGLVQSKSGKVRLIPWGEYDPGAYDPASDERPTAWEGVHHLIERLHSHGEEGAALLLIRMKPETTSQARELAYRLYSICERRGWAEYARDYNTLIVTWPEIVDRAALLRDEMARGGHITQATLGLDV